MAWLSSGPRKAPARHPGSCHSFQVARRGGLASAKTAQVHARSAASPLIYFVPPVRLTLQGRYWDSQLYSGSLVLFGRDGSLFRANWERFVHGLPLSDDLQ